MKTMRKNIGLFLAGALVLTLFVSGATLFTGCDDNTSSFERRPHANGIYIYKAIVGYNDPGPHDYLVDGSFPSTSSVNFQYPQDGDEFSHDVSCYVSRAIEGVGVDNYTPFIVNSSSNHGTLAAIASITGFPTTWPVYGPNGTRLADTYADFLTALGAGTQSPTLEDAGVLDTVSDVWWSGTTNTCTDWSSAAGNGSTGDLNSSEATAADSCATSYYRLCIGW